MIDRAGQVWCSDYHQEIFFVIGSNPDSLASWTMHDVLSLDSSTSKREFHGFLENTDDPWERSNLMQRII